MELGAGWLKKKEGGVIANVFVPEWSVFEQAPFPTRRTEYRWVADQLRNEERGIVVDAGCGFNRDIHLLPYILGNMSYRVFAFDPQLGRHVNSKMPDHVNVFFANDDMTRLPLPAGCADYWLSISVMEHVEPTVRSLALMEARNVLKPGGYLLLTTDDTSPDTVNNWLDVAGFQVGPVAAGESDLTPKVAYAVARRPPS